MHDCCFILILSQTIRYLKFSVIFNIVYIYEQLVFTLSSMSIARRMLQQKEMIDLIIIMILLLQHRQFVELMVNYIWYGNQMTIEIVFISLVQVILVLFEVVINHHVQIELK